MLCCSVLFSLAVSVDVWFTRAPAGPPAMPLNRLGWAKLLFVVALFGDAEAKAEDELAGSDLVLSGLFAVAGSIFTVVEAGSGWARLSIARLSIDLLSGGRLPVLLLLLSRVSMLTVLQSKDKFFWKAVAAIVEEGWFD